MHTTREFRVEWPTLLTYCCVISSLSTGVFDYDYDVSDDTRGIWHYKDVALWRSYLARKSRFSQVLFKRLLKVKTCCLRSYIYIYILYAYHDNY